MNFQITTIATVILAFWFLVLSVRVMQARGSQKVSLGDGGDVLMIRRIRGQGNFVEYVPLALILMGLAESNGAEAWMLWLGGGALVLGRVMHGYAFSFTNHNQIGRAGGTTLTFVSYVVLLAANIWLLVR